MKNVKKHIISIGISLLLCLGLFPMNVCATETVDGDMTYEEGAKQYVETPEDLKIKREKEMEIMQTGSFRYVPDAVNYELTEIKMYLMTIVF